MQAWTNGAEINIRRNLGLTGATMDQGNGRGRFAADASQIALTGRSDVMLAVTEYVQPSCSACVLLNPGKRSSLMRPIAFSLPAIVESCMELKHWV